MTDGEQRVGRALGPQRDTGDAITLWWQEPVLADLRSGGGDRCPDFVILDGAYGLFVLEVKDWAIDQIQYTEPRQWTVRKGGTSRKETAPAEQAKAASFVLRNLIEANPKLRQTEGNHQNKALLPVEYGAVLPNIRREQARTRGLLDALAGQHYFQDDLQSRGPEESDPLAARLRSSVRPRFPFPAITPELADSIAATVQPKQRFDAPPDLRTEGERLLIERLDAEQQEYARSIGDGHRILTGCAGSGKTLVVAARARFLKQLHPEWRVRILCFNAELVPHIYALLGDVQMDAEPKIVVQNFHAFARECLGTAFQRNEREDDTAFAHRTEQAFLAFAAAASHSGLYDALLIDEGQDLQPDWTRALVSLVNPATQSVLFAASRQQNIYGITSYKNLGIDATGRTKHLRTKQVGVAAWCYPADPLAHSE